MSNANATPVKTLGDIAIEAAVRAVANDDRATWSAVTSLALVMVGKQFDILDSGKPIDEAKNKAAFRTFLKVYASKGNVVWRGTESLVDQIMARRGAERVNAVNAYIDGVNQKKGETHPAARPEGSRLTDGLARLRTWSFRLMADVLTNEQDTVREIYALKASGASADTQVEKFRQFVGSRYGETFARLSFTLAKDGKKKTPDAVDSMVEKAKKLTDAELSRLVRELTAVWTARNAETATDADAFGGIETGEAAPETVPAETAAETAEEAKPARKKKAA